MLRNRRESLSKVFESKRDIKNSSYRKNFKVILFRTKFTWTKMTQLNQQNCAFTNKAFKCIIQKTGNKIQTVIQFDTVFLS